MTLQSSEDHLFWQEDGQWQHSLLRQDQGFQTQANERVAMDKEYWDFDTIMGWFHRPAHQKKMKPLPSPEVPGELKVLCTLLGIDWRIY